MLISVGAAKAKTITNNTFSRLRLKNETSTPKKPGQANIQVKLSASIATKIATVNALNGLHSLYNIARPVNTNVIVAIEETMSM